MNKEEIINNEKKKKYAIVICFLVLMICITGSTYAYFALTASNNSITGTVGGGSLSLTVSKVLPVDNDNNMIPQLESTLGEAISDTYNCVDGNGNVVCQVYSATVQNIGSNTVDVNGTISFTGIDNMPNLKWKRIDSITSIGEYSSNVASTSEVIFDENKSLTDNESATYYFVIWIDETGEVQTDNGTFRAIINFDSSTGGLTSTITPGEENTGTSEVIQIAEYGETAAVYMHDLYYDGTSKTIVNIGGDTSNPLVSLNSSKGIMLDNNGEYRYYGANPNNYVSFNGELWRIINVSNVKSSEEDITGEQRVRIIRADSIGDHPWDYNGGKNWSTATLNTTLNDIYYNSNAGTCYNYIGGYSCDFSEIGTIKGLNDETRELIDNALYYLGAISEEYGLYANDFYTSERGTTVAIEGYPTIWIGKLGLIYPSDYLYATDLSKCIKDSTEYDEDTTNCTGTDWLLLAVWSLSTNLGNGSGVYRIGGDVVAGGGGYPEEAMGVVPVAVLKSDVTITGGSGTSDDPYTLSLG